MCIEKELEIILYDLEKILTNRKNKKLLYDLDFIEKFIYDKLDNLTIEKNLIYKIYYYIIENVLYKDDIYINKLVIKTYYFKSKITAINILTNCENYFKFSSDNINIHGNNYKLFNNNVVKINI